MPGPIRAIREWWNRGVADPWQFVDSVTPGNWRQNNHFDAAGAVAGGLQMATGFPAALSQPLMNGGVGRISGLFASQNNGLGDRTGLGPIRPSGMAQAPVDAFGNTLGQTRTPVAQGPRVDAFGNTIGANERDPNFRMQGVSDAPRHSSLSNGAFRDLGGSRGTASSQHGLGAGQTFGSQLSFADHYEAQMRRGTTHQEA